MAFGPLRYTKVSHFTVAFFLTVLLSEVRAIPGKTDWWLDPCDSQSSRLRHPRSPGSTQLHISIGRMNALRKNLVSLYPNYSGKCPSTYGKCLQMKGLIQKVRKSENTLDATTQFYISLSKLAMYLVDLSKVPLNHDSNKFNDGERTEYYKDIKQYIKLSLCEASYDISILAPDKEILLFEKVKKLSNKKSKCVPSQLDLTSAQIIDNCFFERTLKFLNQSRKHLRKLTKRQQKGTIKNQRKKKRTKKL